MTVMENPHKHFSTWFAVVNFPPYKHSYTTYHEHTYSRLSFEARTKTLMRVFSSTTRQITRDIQLTTNVGVRGIHWKARRNA